MNRGPRHGQAALMMTLSMFFLFSIIGLCVDLGWAYFRKQAAQAAADSAASAAAAWANANGATCGTGNVLCQGATACASLNSTSSLKVGCQYAATNDFTDGGRGGKDSVTMQGGTGNPPIGPANNPNYWVVATVTETIPELFLGFAGFTSATVRAQAVAGVAGTSGGTTITQNCMYTLDTTAAQSFFASGSNSSVTMNNCGMYVNSSADSGTQQNNNALVMNGQASLTLTGSGGSLKIKGGAWTDAGYCKTGYTCHAAAQTDPLASLAAPTFSGCDYNNYSFSNGTTTLNPTNKAVVVFCGGMNINGGTLTLNPGVYVLNGGGINIGSASTNLTGSGVMFYNTATSGHTIAQVNISGQPHVTLSAPTTGTYKGVLFYQDRTTSYAAQNQIAGYSAPAMTGTMYFPGSTILFTGTNPGTAQYTVLIAKKITFNGGATFKWDNTGTYTGIASSGTSTSFLMQ